MINVFIITQNEPFYIPKMVRFLVDNQFVGYKIIGYTVLSPSRKNKSIYTWIKERTTIYSYFELFIVGLAYSLTKVLSSSNISYSYSNEKILRNRNIKGLKTNDINCDSFIKEVTNLNPDIILSISCPQLFGDKLLKAPTMFCLNAHGTLLPSHRGVFGSFWTLFNNDKVAGGTIHTMELKLDAGEILWQREFEVEKNDTQYSIAYKTKKIMAAGLVELFKQINMDKLNVIQPNYKSSYHRAPTKEQGNEFRIKGYKIVKIRDLKYMLSQSY
jgi:methionyl-tRNA formyltransferase